MWIVVAMGMMMIVQSMMAQTPPTAPVVSVPQPKIDQNLPTVFFIGDSTVKNGRDDGAGGLWGWGNPIVASFDLKRINVQNRALEGRSSRTFITEGLWDKVLADMKPGDFVLIQFGHNDGGAINDATLAGAQVNAACVIEGLKAIKDCRLNDYLLPAAR